jgi:TRAP-type transport system periplasmic protein
MRTEKWNKMLVTLAAVVLVYSLLLPHSASAKSFKWKLFLYFPPQVAEDYAGWCKEIREKTDGNLDIKVYYDGEHPFKAGDLLTALKDGAAEMANVCSAYLGGVEPMLMAHVLPMIPTSSRDNHYIVEHIRQKWYDAILETKYNQKVLTWISFPGQAIHTKDIFLENWESLKGKKIRIYSKDTANWVVMLKGAPVTIPLSEVYTAAQRGVVDGATVAVGTGYDSKWFEIFKYTTVTEYTNGIDGINVNLTAWNSLPDDYKQVVLETAKKWQYRYQLRREMDFYMKNVWAQKNYGVKVTYISPGFRAEMIQRAEKEIWPDWVERTKEPQKAWEAVKDCVKYRDEFNKMSKKEQNDWLVKNNFPKEVLELE